AQLKATAAKGNTVEALGTKTIRGATVSGYSVTVSRQNLIGAVQRSLSSSGLSAGAQSEIRQEAQNVSGTTSEVWFDSSNLLRRMAYTETVTENGKAVDATLVMDFVNYGAQVSIVAPQPDDVVSFNDFVAAAQAAGSSLG
ncbi:MAG: hypothetical protein ACRD6W_13665, partial [Nitrososphaerales archaeon]